MTEPSPKRETLELAFDMAFTHRRKGGNNPPPFPLEGTLTGLEKYGPSLSLSSVTVLAETLEKLWAADPSTRPVSGDLLLARKIMADSCSMASNKENYLSGKHDNGFAMTCVVAGIEAARKAEREKLGKATGE